MVAMKEETKRKMGMKRFLCSKREKKEKKGCDLMKAKEKDKMHEKVESKNK